MKNPHNFSNFFSLQVKLKQQQKTNQTWNFNLFEKNDKKKQKRLWHEDKCNN